MVTRRKQSPQDRGFARRLKDEMQLAGIKPGRLKKLLGVHASTVSKWRGGRVPESRHLARLASLLGVNADWLANEKGDREAPEKTAARVAEPVPTPYAPEGGYDALGLVRAAMAALRSAEQQLAGRAEPTPSDAGGGPGAAIATVRRAQSAVQDEGEEDGKTEAR